MPNTKLKKPWLVAVWPGMGQVALAAGYYLMAKLGMHAFAEFAPRELFDAEYVDVTGGLIRVGRLPRSQLFVGNDPHGEQHDLILFIGEAQPAAGKYDFCNRLIECAQSLGVERVFTFASIATPMHPQQHARVFAAATDEATLAEFQHEEVELLVNGQIGGLNGLLLGVAAERGMHGACLMGEIPQVFARLPSPKAALAILETFTSISGIKIDLGELEEQAADVENKLSELLTQLEAGIERALSSDEEEDAKFEVSPPDEPVEEQRQLSADDEARVTLLFAEARRSRPKAYELKKELDRLGVFVEYEDRFLDLFEKPG